MEYPEDAKVQENAEEDMFSQLSAKSSVKLKNTTRGVTWEIKVVTGEECLISGLCRTAVDAHEALKEIFDKEQ